MGHDHSHAVSVTGNEKRLFIALGLTASFHGGRNIRRDTHQQLGAPFRRGAYVHRCHRPCFISSAAIRIGKREVDDSRSYGYQRFEILAAAFNAILLFAVAGYILYEAYRRLQSPPEVATGGMLAIAVAGFFINLIAMKLSAVGSEATSRVRSRRCSRAGRP